MVPKIARLPFGALESPIVRILVSPEKCTFAAHRDVLCYCSSYFRGAFRSKLQESSNFEFALEDDRPELVSLMLQWMYTGELSLHESPRYAEIKKTGSRSKDCGAMTANQDTAGAEEMASPSTELNKRQICYSALFELSLEMWIAADKRGIFKLQNDIINLLHDHIIPRFIRWPFPAVCAALTKTSPHSSLWKFLTECFVLTLTFHDFPDGLPWPTLVDVLVGPEKKIFRAHIDAICSYSSYFQGKRFKRILSLDVAEDSIGAFKNSFKEAQELRFELEDDDPDVFEIVLHWIYTLHLDLNRSTKMKEIKDQQAKIDEKDEKAEFYAVSKYRLLGDVWIFADKRGMPFLQDITITVLFVSLLCRDSRFCTQAAAHLWHATGEQSKLRSFIVEHFVWRADLQRAASMKVMPKEFFVQAVARLDSQPRVRRSLGFRQGWSAIDVCVPRAPVQVVQDADSNGVVLSQRHPYPTDSWRKSAEDVWSCALHGRILSLRQTPTHLHYSALSRSFQAPPSPPSSQTSEDDDTLDLVKHYLNLGPNLTDLYEQWMKADPNFRKKAPKFAGVRILRQDAWEALVGFICSSNNNIARISQMVEKLCKHYGRLVGYMNEEPYHDFPTPKSLTNPNVEQHLRSLGFGYRAKYLYQTAVLVTEKEEGWLDTLRNPESPAFGKAARTGGEMRPEGREGYRDAHEALLSLQGVGPKVADCVCLMGLGWGEAVPVDTHVWQIAVRDYKFGKGKHSSLTKATYDAVGNKFRSLWGKEAGWAHSVLFTADLRAFSERLAAKIEVVKEENLIEKGSDGTEDVVTDIKKETVLDKRVKPEFDDTERKVLEIQEDLISRVKRRRRR
ncbi:MAG: hypothetical protein Q9159_000529 [Coniocarpon cinnabarinum]